MCIRDRDGRKLVTRFVLCCHSNTTRAPIANLPNSAQLGGIPTTPPSYIRVHAIVWACSCRQTHTDTETDTQTRVTTIHFVSSTTHAKCNSIPNRTKHNSCIAFHPCPTVTWQTFIRTLCKYQQNTATTLTKLNYDRITRKHERKLISTSAKEDMFSSLFVCLLATLRRNFQTDVHEIFREGCQYASE